MRRKERLLYFLTIFVAVITVTFILLQLLRPLNLNKGINRYNEIENASKTTEQFLKNQDPLESIRRDCGMLCDLSIEGVPGPYFDHIKVPVNCRALFQNDYIDQGHGLRVAPKEIPKHLFNEFTMNRRINNTPWYFNEVYLGTSGKPQIWTKELIENQRKQARQGTLEGTYTVSDVKALIDGLNHAPNLKNGRVLVIGSQNPWVEACILEAGAREVVTLEYGPIISKHPQVKTLLPADFRKLFLEGKLRMFDAVVTYSSVEHSGLGRFGDGLNPWGDIISIARAWCVTRKGGSLTIGVAYNHEKDAIQFNAHRIYGKIRYPFLTANWEQHYQGHGPQRVFVFTRTIEGVD